MNGRNSRLRMREIWDQLIDWLDEPTGLRITTVNFTRWNVLSTATATSAFALYAWLVGSWRLFALLFGSYALCGLLMFMWRERQGDG